MDYGFECSFFTEGEIDNVDSDYWTHMNKEHGIDYSKETIGRTIKKKFPTQTM
jgi:predicted small metal-binding protein